MTNNKQVNRPIKKILLAAGKSNRFNKNISNQLHQNIIEPWSLFNGLWLLYLNVHNKISF